jgi:hypothetical protein
MMSVRLVKTTFLNLIYPITLIFISISTYLIRKYGPEPFIDYSNTLVNIKDLAIVEKRDQYILFSWLFILIAFAIFLLWRNRSFSKKFNSSVIIYLLIFIALFLTLRSALWSDDLYEKMTGTSLWSGISPIHLVIGGIFGVILLLGFSDYRPRVTGSINFLLIFISIFYILPNLIQLPKYLDDQTHFNFVADDLIANSIGKTILFDYFPVYTNVLGIPLAPILNFSPNHPVQLVVYYLILLQAIILLISFLLIKATAPKRLVPLSFLILILPIFAIGDSGTSPSSYFPIFPLRIVIPLICVYLSLQILFPKHISKYGLFSLGVFLGINIFNNLEFGLTSSLSIFLAALILLRKSTLIKIFVFVVLAGIATTFISIYSFFELIDKPLKYEEIFLFIKLTLSGYNAVPMDAFGIHLIIVALFITGCVISANQLLRTPISNSKIIKRNYLLFIISLWSVMILPYFVGRSFPSTILGGFGFHYALIMTLILPTIFSVFKVTRSQRSYLFVNTIFLLLGLSIILSLLFNINDPRIKINEVKEFKAESSEFYSLRLQYEFFLEKSNDKTLSDLFKSNSISQILPLSGALESQIGLPSELVTNHPWHLEVTPLYTTLQCEYSKESKYRYVLTNPRTIDSLALNPACSSVFDFKNVKALTEIETNLLILGKK